MKIRLAITCLVLILVLGFAFVPSPLAADDFGSHEIGARAAALGGAFTARADDITSIYYNPAGLAFLKGLRVKTNLAFSRREIDAYVPEADKTFESSLGTLLPNFFLSWQPVKRVSLGLGYFSPYNFRSAWSHLAWPADNVSTASELDTRTLRSVLSAEVLKGLAFGVALDFVAMSVRWNNTVPFQTANYALPSDTEVGCRHSLSGHGLGFTASALWKVFPALQVGARYRKSAAVDLAGGNTFIVDWAFGEGEVPDPHGGTRSISSLLDLFFVSQRETGKMTLPREIAVGVALAPVPRLSFYLDVLWDKWSEFGRWEFRSVNSDENLNPAFTTEYQEFYGVVPNYGTLGTALTLRDSRKLKAGAEYRLGRWFSLRAGFARNESSVDAADLSPIYPDLDRSVYSLGGGYQGPIYSFYDSEAPLGELSFDVFFRYSSADRSASTLPGLEMTYGATGWVTGIGVGFSF
jgi:long-chain fatty acid transport protein